MKAKEEENSFSNSFLKQHSMNMPVFSLKSQQNQCFFFLLIPLGFISLQLLFVCCSWRILTIHFSLVWQDNLPSATGRVDGEGLLKALLDIWAPNTLCISVQVLVFIFPVQPIFWATVGIPLLGRNGGGSPWARPWAPRSKDQWEICKTKQCRRLFYVYLLQSTD